MDTLKNTFQPYFKWDLLKKEEYKNYGIINISEAEIVDCYIIGEIYGLKNTLVIYNYGINDGFVADLVDQYKELQIDYELQEELNVFPMHWEIFENNCLFSVFKLINNPVMSVLDIFFEYNKNIICFHTYIEAEEKHFDLLKLCNKYPNIRHIINEITRLKN